MKSKKSIFIFLISLLLASTIPSVSVLAKTSNESQAETCFLKSAEYKKVENKLVSNTPKESKTIFDENNKPEAELLLYSVKTEDNNHFSNKDAQGTVNLSVQSPLVVDYNLKTKKINAVTLLDYSKFDSKSNKMKVTNFTDNSNALVSSKSLGENVEKYAHNINSKVNQTVNSVAQKNSVYGTDSINSSVACSIFVCTKYKSGGGHYNGKCMTIANTVCDIGGKFAGKFAYVVCRGANLWGCYVPKYKTCVRGSWKHYNVCPAQG